MFIEHLMLDRRTSEQDTEFKMSVLSAVSDLIIVLLLHLPSNTASPMSIHHILYHFGKLHPWTPILNQQIALQLFFLSSTSCHWWMSASVTASALYSASALARASDASMRDCSRSPILPQTIASHSSSVISLMPCNAYKELCISANMYKHQCPQLMHVLYQ